MNYTKGEWKVGHYIVYTDKSTLICNANIGIVSEGEKTANAHLIAAAPKMYEALKEIYETELNADVIRILQPWLERVERILAKAEGAKWEDS